MSIRILIVDDHGLIRAGLRALLEDVPDMEVVGEVADGLAVLRLAAELQPDIVLMDISMPGLNGIEATRRLVEISPQSRVLALTVHEEEGMLREMIRAGAYGYIIKRAIEEELINAIRVITQGNMYIDPAMTKTLLKDISPHAAPAQPVKEALTPREIDVLRLLARGYTNRQIAQELNISPRTVEGHRSSLVSKLGFSGRVELINYAEETGLIGLH
jgi:two-component system, NarL family, response regulator NreC